MFGIDFSKIQGNPLRIGWDRFHRLPGGKKAFSKIIGEMAPYTGTLGAEVVTLKEGQCVLKLTPRRRLTNHLNSIHAVALMNLGEMCTGVAMMYLMPGDMRGIPTELSMEYMKKARGVIHATCDVPAVRNDGTDYQQDVEAVLRDEAGDIVARFTALWQLGPKAR